MRFLVITDAPTLKKEGHYTAYAPYVKEMDIWFGYVNEVTIISPTSYGQKLLLSPFKKVPKVISVPALHFISFYSVLKSMVLLPWLSYRLLVAMYKTDHIHLRCPGNIGLLGCFVQAFFPKKIKTAKYAGNWDTNAKQPLSYKLQKWILSNTFLTKNMTVLVYGAWENQSKNIKPFFTASYFDTEIKKPKERHYNGTLRFVFIGSLVYGKRPLLAIKTVEALVKQGQKVSLELYGDGVLRLELEQYVSDNQLETFVVLKGNQDKEIIKKTLQEAHFLMLFSKSEGWPKAVAEAMFFGTIPIATRVSCVPYMLDYGKRGILVASNLEAILNEINTHLKNQEALKRMSEAALNWSQNYTLDVFETAVSKLLN
tara:strand:- start:113867 stop:114976 length:1110 start_codon:yes stop_codon:yes gene_type:complete